MAIEKITARHNGKVKTHIKSDWARIKGISPSYFCRQWNELKAHGRTDQQAIDMIDFVMAPKNSGGAPLTREEKRYNATIRPWIEAYIFGRGFGGLINGITDNIGE